MAEETHDKNEVKRVHKGNVKEEHEETSHTDKDEKKKEQEMEG